MSLTQTRQAIKVRLQSEAARQWGIDETDLKNGSFDPLVDLLFGAFSVEMEKLWQEMEASRSRIVKRMAETVLPEVVTGIVPAHTVIRLGEQNQKGSVVISDQFSTSGSDGISFSPAGSYNLEGANVRIMASGDRIDRITGECIKQKIVQLNTGKQFLPNTCWLGIELPNEAEPESLCLFFNWTSVAEQIKYIPYISSIGFFYQNEQTKTNVPLTFKIGIDGIQSNSGALQNEENVRAYYDQHFVTLQTAGLNFKSNQRKYPAEWESLLDDQAKAMFSEQLLWIKLVCPASISPEALGNMLAFTNCIPVLNRKRVHQRGRLQALFNVYALKDENGFLGIDQVLNGDGEELKPAESSSQPGNTYTLRRRNVARFDRRDAFETLSDVTAKMRDDLAAFDALDNSILSGHLEQINRSIRKMNEHLESFDYELPQIYLMANTRSAGNILDIYFWTSRGSAANGLPAMTKLNPESANSQKFENVYLMLPTIGGKDAPEETAMRNAFREAMLTRGKAVTIEDFRIIARNLPGLFASDIHVRKILDIGEPLKEGVRKIIEVMITPDVGRSMTEEYWMQQARLVKNTLTQRSTGVIPLFVSVKGYNWKV